MQETQLSGDGDANSSVSKVDDDAQLKKVESHDPNRESWSSTIDFLLSVIGFAVDLSAVWRFPYLCYSYGGGAFLIPYLLINIFQAVPLLYMELVLGQVNQNGPIKVWDICPLARGLGMAQNLMSYLVAFYYNVIIGWCFLYLFNSLSPTTLPWMKCNNEFNTEWCVTLDQYLNKSQSNNATDYSVLATQEFFERGVLRLHESSGMESMGSPILVLVICVLVVYVCLYFSLWRGVKTSGKVVYVTAVLPYIIMFILIGNGARLPGSLDGIKYFIVPDLTKLNSIDPWVQAAIQVFYSTGAGFGVHMALASYSSRTNNCYRDSLLATGANIVANFLAGFVVFAYLGYMAQMTGKPIESVATQGPGLVFQVYPVAIGTLPVAPMWSILFFALLITLGMDSAMGGMESVLTGLGDYLEKPFKGCKCFREVFSAIVIGVSFLVSISMCTPGGMYLWNLMNNFAAGLSIIVIGFTQAVVISWIYGLFLGMDQFCRDIRDNLGFPPGIYWRVCWKYVSPIFILVIIVFTCMAFADTSGFLYIYQYSQFHPELFANRTADNNYYYEYTLGGKIVGWVMCFSQLALIIIVAFIVIIYYRSLAKAITPVKDHDQVSHGLVTRYTAIHWFTMGPRDTFPMTLCRNKSVDNEPDEHHSYSNVSMNNGSDHERHASGNGGAVNSAYVA